MCVKNGKCLNKKLKFEFEFKMGVTTLGDGNQVNAIKAVKI